MIAYSTLGTNDMTRAIAFYDAVLGALGGVRELTSETWTRYGRAGERAKVCLVTPFDRERATHGNGAMLAFEAPDRAAVDTFHAAALAQGGADEGAPGLREATAYAAYVRDPDGNKLCVFTVKLTP
jgi:catechol 2,3-dioxygenase-like lactoylglutathione lyase family enzyme